MQSCCTGGSRPGCRQSCTRCPLHCTCKGGLELKILRDRQAHCAMVHCAVQCHRTLTMSRCHHTTKSLCTGPPRTACSTRQLQQASQWGHCQRLFVECKTSERRKVPPALHGTTATHQMPHLRSSRPAALRRTRAQPQCPAGCCRHRLASAAALHAMDKARLRAVQQTGGDLPGRCQEGGWHCHWQGRPAHGLLSHMQGRQWERRIDKPEQRSRTRGGFHVEGSTVRATVSGKCGHIVGSAACMQNGFALRRQASRARLGPAAAATAHHCRRPALERMPALPGRPRP